MDDDTDERSGLAELNKRVDCPGLKEPMHLYAMEKVIPTGYFKTMAQVRMSDIERSRRSCQLSTRLDADLWLTQWTSRLENYAQYGTYGMNPHHRFVGIELLMIFCELQCTE
jgi:hypothetical protein